MRNALEVAAIFVATVTASFAFFGAIEWHYNRKEWIKRARAADELNQPPEEYRGFK